MMSIGDLITAVSAFNHAAQSILPARPPSEGADKPTFDLAIVTATADEFDSVTELLANQVKIEGEADDSCTYYSFILSRDRKEFSVVVPYPLDMGIPSAVCVTTKILSNFHPDHIFMTGIAAGNKNVNKFGDILIAEKSINYDEVVSIEKKDGTQRSKFMQNSDSINKNLKSKLSQFARSGSIAEIRESYPDKVKIKHPLRCHIGLVVTGSTMVRSQIKVDEIVRDYHNVIGLDMETCGFYYSAAHTLSKNVPKFVSIKSVSDFGDQRTYPLTPAERKRYALYTSSHALIEFILGYL
jgi:nucleoside phosphorylase